uniref:Girdin-like n=2 Tax=Cucumis melo TaxID=3656 RepID=A0A9I9EI24_CUCME
MNKANRSLKNLESGKEYFLELVNDLNSSIRRWEAQILDLEAHNHSLHQSINSIHVKMAERSEEYEILKNYVDSLHSQLTAFQNSNERIVQEYESLKMDYVQMKVYYDIQMRDFQVLMEHVDQTIEFLRMTSIRANGLQNWQLI